MRKQISKYRKNAEDFWSDFKNIKWFSDEPAPPYWVELFKELSTKSGNVLDLGCGAGRNTEMLMGLGFKTYACDLYENMVLTTKNRLLKAGFDEKVINKQVFNGDMLDIKFPDEFFDAVLSNGVFHNAYNLEEFHKAIKEATRVLKREGCLCFNMFSSACVESFKKIDRNVYVTKEGLAMTLVSGDELEVIGRKFGLILQGEMIEYEREVSTGVRAVMRGRMVKI